MKQKRFYQLSIHTTTPKAGALTFFPMKADRQSTGPAPGSAAGITVPPG